MSLSDSVKRLEDENTKLKNQVEALKKESRKNLKMFTDQRTERNRTVIETWTSLKFSPEKVQHLCGGKFPESGFSWSEVAYFRFEDGVFDAYNGFEELLPAPSIPFTVGEVIDGILPEATGDTTNV